MCCVQRCTTVYYSLECSLITFGQVTCSLAFNDYGTKIFIHKATPLQVQLMNGSEWMTIVSVLDVPGCEDFECYMINTWMLKSCKYLQNKYCAVELEMNFRNERVWMQWERYFVIDLW